MARAVGDGGFVAEANVSDMPHDTSQDRLVFGGHIHLSGRNVSATGAPRSSGRLRPKYALTATVDREWIGVEVGYGMDGNQRAPMDANS